MAIYEVTGPDGKVYEVTGPEGATKEQVLSQLQAYRASAKKDIPKKEEPWYEDMAEGIGVSALDLYYGVKDLGGKLTEEDKATLKDWKEDASQSGYGTAGRILGEIAQFAIPGGAALKGARALSSAKKIGLGTAAALEAASAAGLGATRLPEEGETRFEAAGKEALGSLVGSGIGGAIGKFAGGIRKTPEATELIQRGVNLTPGQAAESPAVRGIEGVMDIIPGLARGTREAREEGLKGWKLDAIKQASPYPSDITDIGTEGFKQARGHIDDLYTDAWKGAGVIDKSTSRRMLDDIGRIVNVAPLEERGALIRMGKNIKKLTGGKPNPEKLKSLDKSIGNQIRKSKNDADLQNDFQYMRDTLRRSMPSDVNVKLRSADSFYPGFLALKEATAAAKQTGGEFTPAQLMSASGKIGRSGRAAAGESPLYDIARAGIETVGRKKESVPLSALGRVSNIAPTPFPMRAMGDVVLGQTQLQRNLNKLIEDTPYGFTDLLNLPRIGAAIFD